MNLILSQKLYGPQVPVAARIKTRSTSQPLPSAVATLDGVMNMSIGLLFLARRSESEANQGSYDGKTS